MRGLLNLEREVSFMNLIQLIAFGWIGAWVLCDSLFPGMAYADKIHTCLFATFVAAYANNAHGVVWRKIKQLISR